MTSLKDNNEHSDRMLESVREFVTTFKRPIERTDRNYTLVSSLIQEEFYELDMEMNYKRLVDRKVDLQELTAELADLIYVCCYAAVVLKLPLAEVFAEKHRANMTKVGDDGNPILREDGKILKGPNYIPPNYDRFFPDAA